MNASKEEALCNNAQNHRQQLLNHQQELERDLEAGSCDEDESGSERSGEESGEGGEGGEGEGGEEDKPQKQIIPAVYNVEPGCTSLGCYSAIITFIVMVIGIVALLMYSSPPNARAPNINVTSGIKTASDTTQPPGME